MEKGTAKLLIEGMIIMEYNEFKASLLEELGDFYGKDAKVYIVQGLQGGIGEGDGICIQFPGEDAAPVISLSDLYKCYVEGNICMDECAGRIIEGREDIWFLYAFMEPV